MASMTEFSFLSSDGMTSIRCREYRPDGEAKGIVQVAHGIAEHIGRYDALARFLSGNGYIVVCNDHLGHGGSIVPGEEAGTFGKHGVWETVVEDMKTLHDNTATRFRGKPYYLFGHSMGSFLARTYLIRHRSGLDGAVLSGTGQQSKALIAGGQMLSRMEIRRHGVNFRSKLLNDVAFGKYNDSFGHTRTPYDWISRDEAVVDEYAADPLCGFTPSAGLFYEMMRGIDYITNRKNVARMKKTLPVLFLSGDKDPVGENGKGVIRAYKSFLKAGMTDVTMKLYHDGRHEMLNELNRDEVFRDILNWLDGKTGC